MFVQKNLSLQSSLTRIGAHHHMTHHTPLPKYIVTLTIIAGCLAAGPCLTPTTPDPLVGCITCDLTTYYPALNISSNLIICSSNINCSLVTASDTCIQCSPGDLLIVDPPNGTNPCKVPTAAEKGCSKAYGNGTCNECISTAYYLEATNSTCQLVVIDYCWRINASICAQCSDQNIKSTSNCSVGTTYCPNFNYQKWVCPSCDSPKVLHESGIFCYDPAVIDDTCMIISSPTECAQCIFGYYYDTTNKSCKVDIKYQLQFELLPIYYYFSSSVQSDRVRVCLDPTTAWTSGTSTCDVYNTTTLKYCLTVNTNNSALCDKCVQSYYFEPTTGKCTPCSSKYTNCLLCDTNNCLQCMPTHFLVLQSTTFSIFQVLSSNTSSTVTQCLPCSIYNCQYCRSEFDSKGSFNVRCDKCLFGLKLYNHACMSCPSGQYFSLSERVCVDCSKTISGIMYCNINQNQVQQCTGSLYFNTVSNRCENISDALANQTLASSNAYEILNKSFPLSSTNIVNDAKLLMTNCNGSSNGFACLCNATSTIFYTSLCYYINPALAAITPSPMTFLGNTSNAYTTSFLLRNSPLLLLLSEMPKYSFTYSPADPAELISSSLFATYLQITTNYIRNNPSQMPATVTALSQAVFSRFSKTFDPYEPTTFSGPGYYFKYTPPNMAASNDDSTVVTFSPASALASAIYIFFSSSVNPSLKKITGQTFVYLSSGSSTQVSLQLKKISFLGSNQQYSVHYTNAADNLQGLSIANDADGYLTIVDMTTSTSSDSRAYFVSTISSSISADMFASERIENLIYRVAFIYILVFLTLYLTLIPLCAIVDCVDSKSQKRKYKASEEGSYQGIKHRTDAELEDEIALKINYKDFFPIYNIANTERPRRLLKLCLFLVNSQHSITFLTLIYFHLPVGQPLIAVLLAIPAYLCTLIMGYLCGLLTLKLPGKTKYLINLISLGYWILWVGIMSSFVSYEYAPYVFTFAIIFFFIDMLIDFLETLLMYFTIKQESRQIKLFKALSRWLSYRGYYEFDKMAKAIDQLRDNA